MLIPDATSKSKTRQQLRIQAEAKKYLLIGLA
jgi:hypothetical protein